MLGSLHVLLTSAAIWLLFIPWALLNTVMFIVGPAGDAPPLLLGLGALALAVAIGVLIRRRPEQGPQILVPLAFVAFAASVLGSLAWTEGNQSLFGFASPEGLFAYFLFVPMAVLTLEVEFATMRPMQGGRVIVMTTLLIAIAMITRFEAMLWVTGPAFIVGISLWGAARYARRMSRAPSPVLAPR